MEPATMMGIGALMGGAGSLMAGFGGGSETFDPTTTAAYWQNRADQQEFATKGIQWRVGDAIAAGLHPLYALGANVPTYSPQAIVGGGEESSGSRWGRAFEGMGQNVSRAALAAASSSQRAMSDVQLQIARNDADKSFWQAAEARANAERALRGPGQLGPAFPSPGVELPVSGQGNSEALYGSFQVTPSQIVSRQWNDPSAEAMSTPMWKMYESRPGTFTPMFPGGQPQEQFENPLSALWTISEAMARDPNWLRNSGIPYGVTLNEFFDWRDAFVKRMLDAVLNETPVSGPRYGGVVRKYIPRR